MKHLKSASIFIVINILAGIINYSFQLIAGHQLTAREFAEFNSWLALASVYTLCGGILQNAANFLKINEHTQKKLTLVLCGTSTLITLIMAIFTDINSTPFWIGLIVLTAVNGWLTGLIQYRLLYFQMAFAGFLIALIKVGSGLTYWNNSDQFTYIKIVVFSFLPSILFLGFHLIRSELKEQREYVAASYQVILAALSISIATALLPQVDILVLSRTLSLGDFEIFVKASIFYKAVFFLFLMLAQFLLPLQVRGKGGNAFKSIYGILPLGMAAILSSGLALFSGPACEIIMDWEVIPPWSYVLVSSFNMSLMTWLFLLIQDLASRGKAQFSFSYVIGFVALAGLQYYLNLTVLYYYALNISILMLMVLSTFPHRNRKPAIS